LKDRIQSQILTHYPEDIDIAKQITEQEAKPALAQKDKVRIPSVMRTLLEEISFQARESEYIDPKSGVSARLSISALENLYSAAERRILMTGDDRTTARITDFWGIVPAITGKVELVYEGEQEGPYNVAIKLFSAAIKSVFLEHFPNPEDLKRKKDKDPYGVLRAWFSGGNIIELINASNDKDFRKSLEKVKGLSELVESANIDELEKHTFMELALHGLAEFQIVSKDIIDSNFSFSDLLGDFLGDMN
jgi:magnesium chelatase subunit I